MATGKLALTSVTRTVQESVSGVQLNLTMAEAAVLHRILCNVGGSPVEGMPRALADNVRNAIGTAVVSADDYFYGDHGSPSDWSRSVFTDNGWKYSGGMVLDRGWENEDA